MTLEKHRNAALLGMLREAHAIVYRDAEVIQRGGDGTRYGLPGTNLRTQFLRLPESRKN